MVQTVAESSPFTAVIDEIRKRMKAAVLQGEQVQQSQSDVMAHSLATGEDISFQDRLGLFIQLEKWKRELDELLALCKSESEKLSGLLLEDFAANGIQRQTAHGLTVYIKTDRYVTKVPEITQAKLCDLLKEHGLGYLVAEGYNAMKLKSWVVDKLKQEEELPEPLKAALNIGEVSKLATMKA